MSFGILLVFPIILIIWLKKRRERRILLPFISISLLILAVLVFIYAWWADKSNTIIMSQYGYDFNALNSIERFKNVTTENIEKVKSLETIIFGIGWPLKAIFEFVIMTPYLFVVYLGAVLTDKIKKERA